MLTDSVQLEWSGNNFQAVDSAVGQIDSDPALELVVVGTAGVMGDEMGLAVFEIGSGTITAEDKLFRSAVSPSDSLETTSVVLCDVDGDGTKDIVVGGYGKSMLMPRGFVYTYTYGGGAITSQYDYDGMSWVMIEDLAAKSGSGHCNINAVGAKSTPGSSSEYGVVLNTDSGTLDLYYEEEKTWLTDSSAYGIDVFSDGKIITAGTAESGWVSNQYLTVSMNPGNITDTFGSTGTNREATSVKVADVDSDGSEEIIVGANSKDIMSTTSAKLYLFDDLITQLDLLTISESGFFVNDVYMTDVDACDVSGDGNVEVLAALEYDASENYALVNGYTVLANSTLMQAYEYDARSFVGFDSNIPSINCRDVDTDPRSELVSVVNLANSTTGEYKIVVAILELEPQVPEITVVSPHAGDSLSGLYTAVINVSDDSPPSDLTVSYRITSPAITSYFQAMNNTGYTYFVKLNLSIYNNGAYTLHFKATDDEGYVAEETVAFFVDHTLFSVNMDMPADGAVIMPGTPIRFSSSLPLSSFVYSTNGGLVNETLAMPYVINTSGWEDGPKKINVWAESVTALGADALFGVVIDGTPPEILANPPTGTELSPGEDVVVTIHDFELDNVTVVLNGVPVDYTGASMPIVIDTSGWAEGSVNNVRVIAHDSAGNMPSIEMYTYMVPGDTEPTEPTEPAEPTPPETDPQLDAHNAAQDLIDQVQQEIDSALSSGADTTAAEDLLEQARMSMASDQYGRAMSLAREARAALAAPSTSPEQPPEQSVETATEAESEGIDQNILIFAGAIVVVLVAWILYRLFRRGKTPKKKPAEKPEPEEPEPKVREEPDKDTEVHLGEGSGKLESYSPGGKSDVEVNVKPSAEPETEAEFEEELGNALEPEGEAEETEPLLETSIKKEKPKKKSKPKKAKKAAKKSKPKKAAKKPAKKKRKK